MRLTPLIICLLIAFQTLAQQDTANLNLFLVKPYLQYATQNSMTILWETKEAAGSSVEFGKAKFNQEKADLSQTVTLKGTRVMHEVALENLTPETNYFWRVVSETTSGQRLVSETYSFKTAVKDSSAVVFALVGDSQKNNDTPWAWDSIARKVWQERPNFIIHAGDLVDWGPKKTDWTEHFFPGGQQLMARIPMYTVLGNHEGDADLYYQYMVNPKPEHRYHFKYGNVEFFMIDTNREVSEGSEQYNWLDQVLAKSTATWKIVIHHHPPYSSESDDHGNTFREASTMGTKARNLTPLYDKYNVDFCLFGHTHVYERTWPLKNNRINQKEGTIYINSGGAGGFLETFAPTRNWFTLELQEGHHFCTFAIFDHTLAFKAIDNKGRVFDSFQMTKSPARNAVVVTQPPAPIIESDKYVFETSTLATLDPGLAALDLHYTLDGSEPNKNAPKYTAPIKITANTTLKARAYSKIGNPSRIVSRTFQQMKSLPASKVRNAQNGLKYKLYKGDWRDKDSTFFETATVAREGTLSTLDLDKIQVDQEYWGIAIEGYLEVPATDTYTFYALDARGLEIFIDGQQMVKSKAERQIVKSIVLEKGKHAISIKSLQRNWRKSLSFGYYDPLLGRSPIPPFDWSH